MKKYWLTGLVLAAGLAFAGAADAQIKIGVGAPITGPNASFGAQLTTGVYQAAADFNAAGGILGQKIDGRTGRRRFRSQAGRFGRQQVRRRRRQVRRRPLQLRRDHSRLRSLRRQRHPDDHALGHQPEGHRARPVGRVPHLRPRRPAGQAVGRSRADRAQGQEDRHRPRQDPLRPRPRRRRQGIHERRRQEGSPLRRRQHRRKGLFGDRLEDQGGRRRLSSCGAACTPKAA